MATLARNFGIIIGAMKSGTTSLFRYLAQHPEISGCRFKEPNFFGDDKNWAKGLCWYQNLWQWNPNRHRIALEASSFYTKRPYYPNVPERMAEVDGVELRFIYIMRHPLDRLESHDMHTTHSDGETPLDVAIPQKAIWASQYAMQLDAYESFGHDRILLLFTDDMDRDPRSVLKTACNFLGVDPNYDFEGLNRRHNTRARYSGKVPQPIKSLKRFRLVKKFLDGLSEPAREKLRSYFVRRVKVDESRFRLSAEQREYVLAQILPDLRRLHAKYAVDVESRWGILLSDGREQLQPHATNRGRR